MVARRGNAPRSAGCEPVALLLSYRANEEVAPAPGNASGFAAPAAMQLALRVCRWALPRDAFLVENQACCFCTMRADEDGGAPRTRTLDTIAGATVFKTASSASRTRSVSKMAPPLGIAPSSHRLTGGPHTLCVERNASRESAHRKPRSAFRIAAGAAICSRQELHLRSSA
jgi:hypothetical protein